MPLLRPLLVCALAAALLCACRRSKLEPKFAVSAGAPSRTGLVPIFDIGTKSGAEGGAVLGTERGELVALGSEGQVRWRASLAAEIAVAPAVSEGIVVAGSVDGEWIGVDAASGRVHWRTHAPELQAPVTSLRSFSGAVFTLSSSGTLRALSASDGHTRWVSAAPEAPLPVAAPSLQGPPVPPVVCDGVLGVARPGDGLQAVEPEDGRVRWTVPVQDIVGLTCHEGRLLVARASGELEAHEARGGELRWRRAVAERLLPGPPVIDGQRLWVRSGARELMGISVQGSGPAFPTALPVVAGASPAIYRSSALIPEGGRTGRLVQFSLSTGETLGEGRADVALRTQPLIIGQSVWIAGIDGRVLAFWLPELRD